MSLHPGERFGRYELVSLLGRGGMAETYRARLVGEAGVTKPVLIKKILPEYANDVAFTTMFVSEARISAMLSHGNIAQVYDFGRVDGEYFLAMEFVDGQPLNRIIKRAIKSGFTALPAPLATFIALEMCRGLHYAHTRVDDSGKPLGIVHRDISPENVIVSYEGQVKIVDFGIAKARELRGFNTEPGIVKGKYLFFSPEQARGEDVDARTDVWATGIVLYEMLCGDVPVRAAPHVAVPKLVKGQFQSPRERNPEVPEELDAIVMHALALNREDRLASCHALEDALAGSLYSSMPRFSAMTLSHFLQELFREDLLSAGRQVQVPGSALEQFAKWRAVSTTAAHPAMAPQASTEPLPAPSADAVTAGTRQRRLMLGGMLGGVVLCAAIVVAVASLLNVTTSPGEDPSRPRALSRGLAPEALGNTSPPRPSPTPAVASREPARPSPVEQKPSTPSDPPPSPKPPAPETPGSAASSIRLDVKRDVIDVRSVKVETRLDPKLTYRISEPGAPRGLPPLFYWLSGPGIRPEEAVGTLSKRPIQVREASAMKIFVLAPATENMDVRIVRLEPKGGKSRPVLVAPIDTASTAKAVALNNLSGASTSLLLKSPGAEPPAGAANVACVRISADAIRGGKPPRRFEEEQQFLLRADTPRDVTGATILLCGVIDDDPSDNEGTLEIEIVRTKRGPEMSAPMEPRPASAPTLDAPEGEAKLAYQDATRLLRGRQYLEALNRATRCIDLEPARAECYMLLGASYTGLKEYDKGVEYYQKFLKLAPDHRLAPRVRKTVEDYQGSKR